MKGNKHIERESRAATKLYNNRSLEKDYRTLRPILKEGMVILDIGCGTGAISKDIAKIIGAKGKVIGIDNTKKFIENGRQSYGDVENLELIHSDLFDFESAEKFDLIIAARVLQWLTTPKEALLKMKALLKPAGQISILDYNHEELEWHPAPPTSMQDFYKIFLKWRKDAGMNNRIEEDVSAMMTEIGLSSIEVLNANEYYERGKENFKSKVGIWSKVAGLTQIVEEGYLKEAYRLQVIEEYDEWVEKEAHSMTMKLKEIRGKMKNDKIKIKKTEVLSDNWYTLNKVTYDYQKQNGEWETQVREAYDRGNGAAILLYNPKKKSIILTKQFRLPTFVNGNTSGMMIEACAGLLDKDNPEDCIRKETEEETGYRVSKVKKIFECYMSPGSVTEILYFFVAEYDEDMKVSEGGGLAEEQENIEVLEWNFEEAYNKINSGEIRDAKTILLLQYAKINKLL